MFVFLYIGVMAISLIANESAPNKYIDNLNLVMVLAYTFIGFFSFISAPNEKAYDKIKDYTQEQLEKSKKRLGWVYAVSFANIGLTLVLGYWLRGIFLFLSALAFMYSNAVLFKKIQEKKIQEK